MVKLATLYVRFQDWNSVRDHVIQNNTLQQRTTNSSKKLCQELLSRLKHLSLDELIYLVECPESEKSILLWISVCRRYGFIRDFAVEVVREHYLNLNYQIEYTDFEVFFSSKLSVHEELADISVSTRSKVRQVVFRMLREAGLLSEQNNINSVVPNSETLDLLETTELEVIGLSDMYELVFGNTK